MADSGVAARLHQIIREAPSQDLGVHAVELATGEEIIEVNAATPRMMASTAKLFTLGAAAEALDLTEDVAAALSRDAGRRSDNAAAEELAARVAEHAPGGWSGVLFPRRRADRPAHVVRRHVHKVLSKTPARRSRRSLGHEYRQVDGSGMKFANVASPRLITGFLRATASRPSVDEFLDTLAVMGVNGTLARRGRGTAAEGTVVAKTGTHLTPREYPGQPKQERALRLSALSGYCLVPRKRGEPPRPAVAFSVLWERPSSQEAAHTLQDRLAEVLVSHAHQRRTSADCGQ